MKKILTIALIMMATGVGLVFFGAFGFPLRAAMFVSYFGFGIAGLGLVILLVHIVTLVISILMRLAKK